VIDRLATSLNPIPLVMAKQQAELANAKTALVEAADALKLSGQQISASVTGLKEMAETAHAALDSAQELSAGIRKYFDRITSKLDQATDRAGDAFATYDRALGSMTESVSEAADSFRTFPTQLRGDVTSALVWSYNEASTAREDELKELYTAARKHFQDNMVNAVSGVMRDLGDAKTELETLTATMNTSIVNAQNAFDHYKDAWQKEAGHLREDIAKQIDPGIRKEMSANAKNALEALEEAARSGDAFVKSTKKTSADIDRVYREAGDRLTNAANTLAKRLDGMIREIESSAMQLETLERRAISRPPGRMRRFGLAVWTTLHRPVSIFPWRKRK
jgi:phage host-nuclease inhibitor protein Gam